MYTSHLHAEHSCFWLCTSVHLGTVAFATGRSCFVSVSQLVRVPGTRQGELDVQAPAPGRTRCTASPWDPGSRATAFCPHELARSPGRLSLRGSRHGERATSPVAGLFDTLSRRTDRPASIQPSGQVIADFLFKCVLTPLWHLVADLTRFVSKSL